MARAHGSFHFGKIAARRVSDPSGRAEGIRSSSCRPGNSEAHGTTGLSRRLPYFEDLRVAGFQVFVCRQHGRAGDFAGRSRCTPDFRERERRESDRLAAFAAESRSPIARHRSHAGWKITAIPRWGSTESLFDCRQQFHAARIRLVVCRHASRFRERGLQFGAILHHQRVQLSGGALGSASHRRFAKDQCGIPRRSEPFGSGCRSCQWEHPQSRKSGLLGARFRRQFKDDLFLGKGDPSDVRESRQSRAYRWRRE